MSLGMPLNDYILNNYSTGIFQVTKKGESQEEGMFTGLYFTPISVSISWNFPLN